MSADWVQRAEASRTAWEALSQSELDALMEPGRSFLDPRRCDACSECTGEREHPEPHDCDCASRW